MKRFTGIDWAMWHLDCYDRMTDHFSRPLDSWTDQELTTQWRVTNWWLRAAPVLMNKVLHPKHKPEMRKAIAYLTILKDLQIEAEKRKTHGYRTI